MSIPTKIICSGLLFFLTTHLTAQSLLEKADKEYELHAYNEAVKSYREVLGEQPANAVVMAKMADCYYQINQSEESVSWFEKAFAKKSMAPVYLLQFGKVLLNQGNYPAAKEKFELYGEAYPEIGEHYAAYCDKAISLKSNNSTFKVKNSTISTAASDFGPAFFQDNLVFSSARSDIKRGQDEPNANWNGKKFNQLFVSTFDANGDPRKPSFLKSDLKNNYNEGPVSFSANGKWVAYCRNNFADGIRPFQGSETQMNIFIAEVNSDGDWINEKPFPYNDSGVTNGFPCLSPDGQQLYFSSNRAGGNGGFDLYVCTRNNNSWSAPENLGEPLNTKGDEIAPFYDGKNLFFSSDWHFGLGGFDIFRAEKSGSSWGRITNLGNGINSSSDDYGFVFDPDRATGFFTSSRKGGKGNEDIYQFSKPNDKITVTVLNATDKSPIANADLDFSDCNDLIRKSDQNGKYVFQASESLICELSVRKEGFLPKTLSLSLSNPSVQVLLTPADEAFGGVIQDITNNQVVDRVLITATNQQNTKMRFQAFSENDGSYNLPLPLNETFLLNYSKAGYQNYNKTIRTGDGKDKKLSLVQLKPVFYTENPDTEPKPVKTAMVTEAPKPKEAVRTVEKASKSQSETKSVPARVKKVEVSTPEYSTLPEKPKPVSKSAFKVVPEKTEPAKKTVAVAPAPKMNKPSDILAVKGNTSDKITPEAFAVQIGSVSSDKILSMSDYANVKPYGNFYAVPENNRNKLRVGVYKTREEADLNRKKIIDLGYQGAFIVSETEKSLISKNLISLTPKGETAVVAKPDTKKTATPVAKTNVKPAATPIHVNNAKSPAIKTVYKVRIAALSKPDAFDSSKLSKIAKVEQVKENKVTLILLSGFSNMEEAIQARDKAKSLGYKDAQLVVKEGNTYKKAK